MSGRNEVDRVEECLVVGKALNYTWCIIDPGVYFRSDIFTINLGIGDHWYQRLQPPLIRCGVV